MYTFNYTCTVYMYIVQCTHIHVRTQQIYYIYMFMHICSRHGVIVIDNSKDYMFQGNSNSNRYMYM